MPSNPPDDQLLRSHLLGELSEEEAEHVEQKLLADDELFLLWEAIEADLLAALDRDQLTSAEKKRVLERLAGSASGRGRLALARFLNAAADRQPAPMWWTAPWFLIRQTLGPLRPGVLWATLAAIFLVAPGVWFARGSLQEFSSRVANEISSLTDDYLQLPPRKSDKKKSEPQKDQIADNTKTRKEKSISPPPVIPPPPMRVVFTLALRTMRGPEEGTEEIHKLSIPPGTDLVEMQIYMEEVDEVEPFHAALRSKETKETVWEKGKLKATRQGWGGTLVLEIPAERLPSGRYEVAVTAGTEPVPQTEELEVVRENR